MNTYKTLVFSSNRSHSQKIRSSLELLPTESAEEHRFDIYFAEDTKQLKRQLIDKNFEMIIIEHDEETAAGFTALEMIQNSLKIDKTHPEIFSGVIFFIGTNDARIALKALNNSLISGYIIFDDLKVNTFGKTLIDAKKKKATLNSGHVNLEHFMEIVSFQDNLIDDLIQRIINISGQMQPIEEAEEIFQDEINETIKEPIHLQVTENTNKPVERFSLGEKYPVSFLDIRIFINDSLSKTYLKYEIEVLFKLVYQFFNSYIEKYNIIRLHSSSKKILAAFLDEKALNCALEIVIKLSQIELTGDTVLSNFKFALGVDTGLLTYTDELENINKNVSIKNLELIMDKSQKNNTVYISQQVFDTLKPKIVPFFIPYENMDIFDVYQFSIPFGNNDWI